VRGRGEIDWVNFTVLLGHSRKCVSCWLNHSKDCMVFLRILA
jgi:hypothetical protein